MTTTIDLLVVQLEKTQNPDVLPFETLSPWILLHRLLAYQESLDKKEEKNISQQNTKEKIIADGEMEI